ncbi:MAG TPA: TonB family protein [Candidatus Saccharicenans sp.]|nr:TonB family protein [Candidatus Saccharicenans sp.]
MAKNKILLIDFDNEFLKFLSRALGDEGYEVQTATDGLAGFEKFSEFQPDLVIMEAMLPKFHGFELCSRITSHPTKKAPVIIVTGIYKDAVYKTEALRSLGASAFFEKPLNLEALLTKVYELIGKPEIKKHQTKKEEEDLDELLKQALASAYTPGQTAETNQPADRAPRREEIRKTPPAPSQDDEIDLILKSKLKDLISTPGEKPQPETSRERPAAAPVKKAEPGRQVAGGEVKKPQPAVGQTPAISPTAKKPVDRETKPAGLGQPPQSEPKISPKLEPERSSSTSPFDFEDNPKPMAPTVNPFKAYTASSEEKKTGKKSSTKYIGLAAASLAVIGLIAFLTLGRKKSPDFSPQPVNQTAALQATETNQTTTTAVTENQPREEDINKEIEKQMAAYRNQQNRTEKSQGTTGSQNIKDSQAGKTQPRNQPPAAAVAPIIPQETPKIEVNMESGQTLSAQAQSATATTGQTEEIKVEQVETPPATAQTKQEEQPVNITVQKARPGEIVPLSMVDVEPKLIRSVDPIYPEVDRRAGVKGNIVVNALISENGDVLEAVVVRGIKGSVALEKEAISAIKKWKFLPAEKDGVKVKVWKPITIGFGLNK